MGGRRERERDSGGCGRAGENEGSFLAHRHLQHAGRMVAVVVDSFTIQKNGVRFRLVSFHDCFGCAVRNPIRPRRVTQPFGAGRVGFHPLLRANPWFGNPVQV